MELLEEGTPPLHGQPYPHQPALAFLLHDILKIAEPHEVP